MKKTMILLCIMFQIISLQARGDTVVAIHGFLTTSKSMRPVRKALVRCGQTVCLWDYPSRELFIQEHGCNLVLLLQQIASNSPGAPIHFVTHSSGALVLRSALNTPGCPDEAKMGRAVLLAPPNQGSSLARRMGSAWPIVWFIGHRSGWQLRNFTPADIKCFGDFPPDMQVFVIAATKGSPLLFKEPNDGFLTLKETLLDTPFYFQCFPVSHGDLLISPEVIRSMCMFIVDSFQNCIF
jgi:hypothetical protein